MLFSTFNTKNGLIELFHGRLFMKFLFVSFIAFLSLSIFAQTDTRTPDPRSCWPPERFDCASWIRPLPPREPRNDTHVPQCPTVVELVSGLTAEARDVLLQVCPNWKDGGECIGDFFDIDSSCLPLKVGVPEIDAFQNEKMDFPRREESLKVPSTSRNLRRLSEAQLRRLLNQLNILKTPSERHYEMREEILEEIERRRGRKSF